MKDPFIDGFLQAMVPPDMRPPTFWAEDNLMIEHSERKPGKFQRDYAPWLIDPIDCLALPEISESTIIGPVQSGKSQALEVYYAWLLCNTPRPCLITGQTDADIANIWQDKFLKTLWASPATSRILEALPADSIRKEKIDIPLMPTDIQGPSGNKIHSKTRPILLCDEAWRYEPGVLAQLKKRRDSATGGKLFVVSQAGRQIGEGPSGDPIWDDLGAHYFTSTLREFEWLCACGARTCPATSQMEWDGQSKLTKRWDLKEVRATARWKCPHCGKEHHPGDTKEARMAYVRDMALQAKYSEPRNPEARPGHEGYRFPVWVVWWKDWGEMAEEYLLAKHRRLAGSLQDFEVWTKQREVQFWTIKAADIPVTWNREPSGYKTADYAPTLGELPPKIEGEKFRIMAVDVQADHFKVVIRAFNEAMESRHLIHQTLWTEAELRDLQLLYRVPNNLVFADAANNGQRVYAMAAKYGWRCLIGRDQQMGWMHTLKNRKINKPFSTPGRGDVTNSPTGAFAYVWMWSNSRVKDLLAQLAAGRGIKWELPDDPSEEMVEAMESEKKDWQTGIWKKVGKRRNHYWDAECMILAGGLACGLLQIDVPEPPVDPKA
jgi:phage terminase large subunit GpA-like protein